MVVWFFDCLLVLNHNSATAAGSDGTVVSVPVFTVFPSIIAYPHEFVLELCFQKSFIVLPAALDIAR